MSDEDTEYQQNTHTEGEEGGNLNADLQLNEDTVASSTTDITFVSIWVFSYTIMICI